MQYPGVHSIVRCRRRAPVARQADRGSHVSILALDDADLDQLAADYADSTETVTTYPAPLARH